VIYINTILTTLGNDEAIERGTINSVYS
jgi:hypothetical protein